MPLFQKLDFSGLTSAVPDTGPNGDDEDSADEEGNDEYDEDVNDECDGDDEDVDVDGHASSFRTFNQVLENEQGIYVSAQAPSCDISNHPDTTGYLSGEFVIGQVFNSKSDLQEAAKIYSITANQEYVVVASSKKLLVLRCKKAEECHCPWKLRAMVVKDTSLFVINKYTGPHTCVNPYLNWDHHQLDSKLVASHIKALIKAQFTLSTAAIQASVMEK